MVFLRSEFFVFSVAVCLVYSRKRCAVALGLCPGREGQCCTVHGGTLPTNVERHRFARGAIEPLAFNCLGLGASGGVERNQPELGIVSSPDRRGQCFQQQRTAADFDFRQHGAGRAYSVPQYTDVLELMPDGVIAERPRSKRR